MKAQQKDAYTLILANPPFAGALDYDSVANDLLNGKTRSMDVT